MGSRHNRFRANVRNVDDDRKHDDGPRQPHCHCAAERLSPRGGRRSGECRIVHPRARRQVPVACGTRGNSPALNSAELFNPATGQWSAAEPGPCNPGFCALDTSATLLGTGKVLVAGSFVGRYPNEFTTVGATLYDPATNT